MAPKQRLATFARRLTLGVVLPLVALALVLLGFNFYADQQAMFSDESRRIDQDVISEPCMDARAVDLDTDGDLDLVLSMERAANRVLLNDGKANFSALAAQHLPQPESRDSEAAAVFDANGDGLLDIVFVSEDDETNEYLWQVQGEPRPHFAVAASVLPVRGRSNAVTAIDIDRDGDLDLIIGNDGPNFALINAGNGVFSDESKARLGERADTTQDVAAGDVDGDGNVDLVFGNEGPNRLMINDGTGRFMESELPEEAPRETRDVDLVDINGDGHLDLVVANVRFVLRDANNQLLLGDGAGNFRMLAEAIPPDDAYSFDAEALDLDDDGAIDLVFGNSPFGDSFFERALAHFWTNRLVALRNTSGQTPSFVDASRKILGSRVAGATFDLAQGDFDGDGRLDLYVCNRGHNGRDQHDVLLLGR